MAYIRQDDNGKIMGYAPIAPPSAETELWFEVAENDIRVVEYLNPDAITMTLERAIAQIQKEIQDHTKFLFEKVVEEYCTAERDGWATKQKEAIAFLASGNPADCPYLAIESNRGGRPLESLATVVNYKSVALHAYAANLSGNRTFHFMAVSALTTVEEVLAYDYSTGWTPG